MNNKARCQSLRGGRGTRWRGRKGGEKSKERDAEREEVRQCRDPAKEGQQDRGK